MAHPVTEFMVSNRDLIVDLYVRWLDESKYEDINDYGARLAREFPNGWILLKSNKRPFGVTVQIDKAIYRLSINSTQGMSWKRES
jgi:hypothetical protein